MQVNCDKMKKSLFVVAVKWGALLGVALAGCKLLEMAAQNVNYDANAFFSILLLVVIIMLQYAGIKEYRDEVKDGYIRFPKAFAVGALTSVVAFVLMLCYMPIHYTYIDKHGLERMNKRNVEFFYAKLEKDTVSQEMMRHYLHKTDSVMRSTYSALSQSKTIDESCSGFTHEQMDIILQAYNDRVTLGAKSDSLGRLYAGFSQYAQHVFLDVYQNLLSNNNTEDSCYKSLSILVNNSRSDMEQINIMDEAYQSQKAQIPHYTSALPVALYSALAVLLYGLFLSIFVALYLTKKKVENSEPETVDVNS